MRALVTGANGFIGIALVKKLLENGFLVRTITRNISRFSCRSNDIEVIVGDLLSEELNLSDLIRGCDVIFHCAGELSDVSKMRALHVDATKRLISAVLVSSKLNGEKKHWVQLSSVGAYGTIDSQSQLEIVTETTKHSPKNEYEITKTISDEILINLSSKGDITYSILRPSNVVGSFMKNQSFALLLNAIKKRKFFFIGTRSSIATYVHVDDVVDALILCGKSPKAKNQIFNISNDCKFSDIANAVALSSGISSNFFCIPEKPLRFLVWFLSKFMSLPLSTTRIDALVSTTTYPSSKLRNILGFVPSRSIPVFAAEYSKLIK